MKIERVKIGQSSYLIFYENISKPEFMILEASFVYCLEQLGYNMNRKPLTEIDLQLNDDDLEMFKKQFEEGKQPIVTYNERDIKINLRFFGNKFVKIGDL